MLYYKCPTCGYLLATKELKYENMIQKLYDKYKILPENADENEDFKKERSNIINMLCKRYCCKQRLLTFMNLTTIVI